MLCLATYEEWHTVLGEEDGRLCSVLFRSDPCWQPPPDWHRPPASGAAAAGLQAQSRPCAGSRNGLVWLHVHETPLP